MSSMWQGCLAGSDYFEMRSSGGHDYGVWVTTDGGTWHEAIPGNASVSSVAAADGLTILGGHLGRGEDATFWVGE